MRIAILTQPLGHNYGGIMQAFALSNFLEQKGHDVILVDRRSSADSGCITSVTLLKRFFRKITGQRAAPILFERYIPDIQEHTNRFIGQYLERSEPIYSSSALKALVRREKVDCIVVGSDQVWRPDYSPCIDDFFLTSLIDYPSIKLSYAASFGHSDWRFTKEETQQAKFGIASFNGISVREDAGVELCLNHLDSQARWVCDPTLLLDSEIYMSLISDIPRCEKGFIFNYILDSNNNKAALASRISDYLTTPQVTCYPKGNIANPQFADISMYKYAPVEEWLSRFRDSEIVLTDSYHGVLFSIIFGKKFLVIINRERGASRFEALLKVVNFSENIIDLDIKDELLKGKLQQLKVLEKPSEFINNSAAFLDQFV